MADYVDGERISCGCCRGEPGRRCVCWIHQDVRLGDPPNTCERHKQHLATDAQPYNPYRNNALLQTIEDSERRRRSDAA